MRKLGLRVIESQLMSDRPTHLNAGLSDCSLVHSWHSIDAYVSLFTFSHLGPNRKQRHCLNLTFPWPTRFLKSSEASRTISCTAFTLALAVHICTQNSLLPGTCVAPLVFLPQSAKRTFFSVKKAVTHWLHAVKFPAYYFVSVHISKHFPLAFYQQQCNKTHLTGFHL